MINSKILIKLDQLNDRDNHPGTIKQLSTKQDWVKSLAKTKKSTIDMGHFVEISKNFDSTHTHAGLLSYVHYAWAKELGIELRPDMLLYTLLSHFAYCVVENPTKYINIFTTSSEKETITTMNLLDINELTNKIRAKIRDKKFASAVCDTEFVSDVSNAKVARRMTFAAMGSAYFDYNSYCCGIPHVEIAGSLGDWKKLLEVAQLIPLENKKSIIQIISCIIYYCFNEICPENSDFKEVQCFERSDSSFDWSSDWSTRPYTSKEDFFSDIFHYGRNARCGSGHDFTVVNGWLRTFCGDEIKYAPERDFSRYETHTSYYCMTDLKTNKMYCEAVSLAFSNYDEDDKVLRPQYGIITYEITDKSTYDLLAKTSKPKIDDDKFKAYLRENTITFYKPAWDHHKNKFAKVMSVRCDRCQKHNLTECYSWNDKDDLCTECYEILTEKS